MKRNIKLVASILAFAFMAGGCQDQLEEKGYDFIDPSFLGSSSEAEAEIWINGALNVLPSEMFRWGTFPRVLEIDADDPTGPNWAYGAIGAGNFQNNTEINSAWTAPYLLIHRANTGIAYVSKMTLPEEVKNNALGQLQFLRAWAYFLLVRAYGPVPIHRVAVPEGSDPQQARASVKEVYDFIIENLQQAEQGLYSTKNAAFKKGRISQGAAKSLLAKVYLTMASGSLQGAQVTVLGGPQTASVNGKTVRVQPISLTHTKSVVAGYEGFNSAQYFTLARDKAKEVMQSGDYSLYSSHLDLWRNNRSNEREFIWTLQALNADAVFGNNIHLNHVGRIQPNGEIEGGWYGVSDQWYETFEETDQRITDGVVHRWKMWGGNHFYPGKDSLVVTGRDQSAEAAAKRAKYGWQPTDQYSADGSHIAMLRKFEFVSDRNLERSDFHFPFLRYADVLLMFAEAENEANGGPTGAAYDAVDQVRTRSGASVMTRNMTQQQFRSFVLEERRRELALENNRRWDLIRWGIYLPVMNAIGVDANSVIKRRQEKHLLFPIPNEEINSNKMIGSNNPGW